jgi:tyrosinase
MSATTPVSNRLSPSESLLDQVQLLTHFRYWEEILDTANLTASPIFDTTYGFGGNGSGNDSCISDGPFANTTLHLGPIYEVTDHCISRSLNSVSIAWANQTYLDECYAAQNYSAAWPLFSSHPHTAGHAAVGGVVSTFDLQLEVLC